MRGDKVRFLAAQEGREYRRKPSSTVTMAQLRWRSSEAGRIAKLNSYLTRKYKLTLDEYDAMSAAQGDVCASCRGPCGNHARLSVDHDHKTGQVRGLLCHGCNTAVGLLKDDPARLAALLAYLTKERG